MTDNYLTTGRGPSVLLLPGMGLNATVFEPLVALLRDDYTCTVVDGVAALASARCNVSDMADALVRILDAQHVAQTVIVGHSMGGFVAQQMAVKHPARVRGVCLLASAHRFEYTSFFRRKSRVKKGEGNRAAYEDRFRRSVSSCFLEQRPGAFERLLRRHENYLLQGNEMICQMQAAVAFDFTEAAAALLQPVQVISGADDAVLPLGAGEALSQLYRTENYVELPNCAHLPMYEQPEAVAPLMKDWLESLPSS